MPRYMKTALQKLETRLQKLPEKDQAITTGRRKYKVRNRILLSYSDNSIEYTRMRYYASRKDDLVEVDFSVSIPLTHENLLLLGSNPINPPKGAGKIRTLFMKVFQTPIENIVIGSIKNELEGSTFHVSKDIYRTFLDIDQEEGRDRDVRVSNRMSPFLEAGYDLDMGSLELERDYSLLLKEVIASKEMTQEDVAAISEQLETGNTSKIVIERQVNRQVQWLIDTIEKALEVTDFTKAKAQAFGKEHFFYPKSSIKGPEHLMEKILTDFGQNTLFGVPALLNTDKYVIHSGESSRCQFDIILINHLGDTEVVELKRPDARVLEYDQSRAKFYPSKDLAIAISQAERYISAVANDNDGDYTINGMKIREYLNEQIGGTIFHEAIRPSALILIGSWKTLAKSYDSLKESVRRVTSIDDYGKDKIRAYRELKGAFKNIKLMNYSELLEHARTRLQIAKTGIESIPPLGNA